MSKSRQVVQMQSPENYIKTRARKLPLGKCYISPEWEDLGIANVLVSRQHVNGNFTFGYYLVDLLCLGIKDTFYRFNESYDALEHWIEKGHLQELDYVTAHNIIYGGEAFAEDYGFSPHKDWKITQFILAPDDEAIEMKDIAFGREGKPVYMAGPYDDEAMINRILATLERNAGPGNYDFVSDYEDDWDEDDWNEEAEDEDDELFAEGDIERILSGEQKPTPHQQYVITILQYAKLKGDIGAPIVDSERVKMVDEELIGANRYSIDDELEDSILDLMDEQEAIFTDDESADVLPQLEQLLAHYPDNPLPAMRLYLLYMQHELTDKATQLAEATLQRFPDFLYFRFIYAFATMSKGDLQDGLALLGGKYYLDEAFPLREEFSDGEFMFFHAALCIYFTTQGDIATAIVYANVIAPYADEYGAAGNAVLLLCKAMVDEVEGRERDDA